MKMAALMRSAAEHSEDFATEWLLHSDVSYQIAANGNRILHPFVDHLLFFTLVAIMFHPQLEDLHSQAVESGHVLVGKAEANVPLLNTGLGLVEENVIALDES